jgi:ADP-heptose:LPS heptosyltransferase
MAQSSETSSSVEEEKKFIVIKLPFDLQERVLAFPFMHALNERYPKSELHIITPQKDIEVLNLLPFKAYYHVFDEDEMQTIFDAHRFVVNAKINRVDIFVSLTNSFVDAFLGLALKAKIRLGFSDGWKTLIFNQKTTRPKGHHISEEFFALLKEHLRGTFDTKLKVMSRDLSPVIEDWDKLPYIAINLSPIRSATIETEWIELISRFENQRFVFFASEERDKVQLLFDTFLSKLPKTNLYVPFILKSWIDLGKMLAFARGVITFNGPGASMAAYTGSKVLVLYDQEDPQRYGPFYFLGESMFMLPELSRGVSVLKPRQTFHMGLVADKAHEFFRL